MSTLQVETEDGTFEVEVEDDKPSLRQRANTGLVSAPTIEKGLDFFTKDRTGQVGDVPHFNQGLSKVLSAGTSPAGIAAEASGAVGEVAKDGGRLLHGLLTLLKTGQITAGADAAYSGAEGAKDSLKTDLSNPDNLENYLLNIAGIAGGGAAVGEGVSSLPKAAAGTLPTETRQSMASNQMNKMLKFPASAKDFNPATGTSDPALEAANQQITANSMKQFVNKARAVTAKLNKSRYNIADSYGLGDALAEVDSLTADGHPDAIWKRQALYEHLPQLKIYDQAFSKMSSVVDQSTKRSSAIQNKDTTVSLNRLPGLNSTAIRSRLASMLAPDMRLPDAQHAPMAETPYEPSEVQPNRSLNEAVNVVEQPPDNTPQIPGTGETGFYPGPSKGGTKSLKEGQPPQVKTEPKFRVPPIESWKDVLGNLNDDELAIIGETVPPNSTSWYHIQGEIGRRTTQLSRLTTSELEGLPSDALRLKLKDYADGTDPVTYKSIMAELIKRARSNNVPRSKPRN